MQREKTHEEQMGDSMVDHTTEERVLPVPLTDDERLQIGSDIAASQEQLEQAEARKSFVMKEINGTIAEYAQEISNLSKRLRDGVKDAKVLVQITRDFRQGLLVVRRTDTGVVLESRPMTTTERQLGLHL